MAWTPRTATLDQVLRFMQLMAESAAYTAEVTAAIAPPNFGALTFPLTDVNGQTTQVVLADTQVDTGWVHTSFAEVQVSEGPRLTPPFPRLVLLAQPGRMQSQAPGGEFRGTDFEGQIYRIDAIVITGADDGQLAQREALILAQAFERLVRRNERNNGLVQLIEVTAPPEPGGIHAIKAGLTSGARSRYEARVLNT